jgi:hypothetical protein
MVFSTRLVFGVAAAVALGQAAVAVPRAQEHFRDSITVSASTRPSLGGYALTFSAPVALPGVALARGTYMFRSPAAHVVQVNSIDGSDQLMFATVPTARPIPTARYSIVLGSADAGAPRRILALFAPGEITGEQFVYRDR